MVNLRDELRMQMWSIHTRYDCAWKVLTHHKDLQPTTHLVRLDLYGHGYPTEAHTAISSKNARRMISTSEEIRQDRYDEVQAGCLSVNMEDVVRHLERMQRCETEEEEKTRWLTKKKQQLWDNQYSKHKHIASQKSSYKASFILEQTLGPRPETPLLDKIANPEEIKKLEEENQEKDNILEDWHTPPGSPWERSVDQTVDTTSLEDTEGLQLQRPPRRSQWGQPPRRHPRQRVPQKTPSQMIACPSW